MTDAVSTAAELDLVYADTPRPLRWNVFRPSGQVAGAPAALLFHGGGWRSGDRANMTDACTAFARLGWVAIAPEYRLLGEAPWPAPLDDVRTAVRAARADAEALGISPDHIFLTGYSAGAHLSLLAAGGAGEPLRPGAPFAEQPEAVAGVAAFFPPTRFGPEQGEMLGISDAVTLEAVSPLTHAEHYPPVILFCGDEDPLTPHEMSVGLYNAIRAAGGVADLRLYSNLIHEFVCLPGMMQATIGDAAAFFTRTVLEKPACDAALSELRVWWEKVLAEPS
jgi:acetyl esterase/lipase